MKRILPYPLSPLSFIPSFDTYDNEKLEQEYDNYCINKSNPDIVFWRLFFEGEVILTHQEMSSAIYKVENADCIISVKNAGHVRMANFPYPPSMPIIAMIFDRRLWGKKRIVNIIEGELPNTFITFDVIDRYKLEKRRW